MKPGGEGELIETFSDSSYISRSTMSDNTSTPLRDTGERMIPTNDGELSYVFARHKFAYEVAREYAVSKRVLDIGCGTGYGCKILSGVALSVVGIDYSLEAIAFCNAKFPSPNVSFIHTDILNLRVQQEFDTAISFQVIEHMADLDLFLDKMKAAVQKGGAILITTPNVREPTSDADANPFHVNEMNYASFHELLSRHFPSFDLLGIGYASSNRLRTFVQRTPLYRLGKMFGRKSPIKKLANTTMNLTDFQVLKSDISRDAIDLFAVCTNR